MMSRLMAIPVPHRRGLWIRKLRRRLNLILARNLIQVGISLLLLLKGWQFYQFVQHFETQGATPYVDRPASVEAFLPISALVSLKVWLFTGLFDPIHPAGLAIFIAVLIVSWLFGKAFCAWLCPIGALAEGLWRFGRRVFGRNLALPRLLDIPLRSVKYLLLLFFINSVVILMPVQASALFQASPYNKIADVKMLQFFLGLDQLTLGVILFFIAGSLFVQNFWCRYACPYGALLGLLAVESPFAISRDPALCTNCQLCTRACPNRIDVARAQSIITPECTSCLNCVVVCPRQDALTMRAIFGRRAINPRLFAAGLLVAFFGILAIAQITGHWQTSLTYPEFQALIPRAELFSH
ncbi:MAG: hypothetical protein A2Z04_08045 [Chloroflexi bacterium RBG_16_57_9]|nr:MAG: hypothetical protein A2Z04_08045 [Chloroflexi bacterium RBG_16_57_9]